MINNNPFFDDLAKIATSAGSTMLEWRKQVEQMVSEQMHGFASRMDMVSREEFEAVRALAQKAITENEALKKRLDALEKSAAPKKAASKAKTTSAKPKPAK